MPLAAPDVDRLFTIGSAYSYPQGLTATVVDLPSVELDLPTGRVFACDPYIGLFEDAEAFTATVGPGTYPVTVSTIEITDPRRPDTGVPHHRAAAARLQVLDRPVARWELALVGGQDPAGLDGDDEYFGYGVDAGTGCFLDAEAAGALSAYQEANDALSDALRDGGHRTLALVTDPGTGHSMAVFPSGWGDGSYPTWIGRTAGNEVACFVTEFFAVPDARDVE